MQSPLNVAGKIVLIIFLLWHISAVFIYSIPREANDIFAKWSRIDLLPPVTPYMFATSQWQLWNIFSPDPLRRVTAYRIEIHEDNRWQELTTIEPYAYSFFRHAPRMKMMGNLLDEFSNNRAPYAGRFLQLICLDHAVSAETPIRLVYRWYVLPQLKEPMPKSWWAQWTAKTTDTIGFTTVCP